MADGSGSDKVSYRIDVGVASGREVLEVELLYHYEVK